MTTPKTVIPQSHVEFCKEVAKLAAKHNLNKFGLTFQPGFDDEWRDQITVNWECGRHGDAIQNLRISSTVLVFAKVDLP